VGKEEGTRGKAPPPPSSQLTGFPTGCSGGGGGKEQWWTGGEVRWSDGEPPESTREDDAGALDWLIISQIRYLLTALLRI
jgi:hypothetical protein